MKGQTIWIIGASSGIGAALAKECKSLGAKVILSARSNEKLALLNEEMGGDCPVFPMDVSDLKQIQQAMPYFTEYQRTLDRVVFLPALYQPGSIRDMDLSFARNALEVNVLGAMHVVHEVLPVFEKQKYGQLALCASVAGYFGLPKGQPYSATKAALINFTETLRAESPDYIDIRLINPGFVRTALTEKNQFSMPMIRTPEQAAKSIISGLVKGRQFEIHFPMLFTCIVKMFASLPYGISLLLAKKLVSSPEEER